jgi:hypothetical protein
MAILAVVLRAFARIGTQGRPFFEGLPSEIMVELHERIQSFYRQSP